MRPILPILLALLAAPAAAATNAGDLPASPGKPFAATAVASFDEPWRMAFVPGGLLVTEKKGRLWRVTPAGAKTEIGGIPKVAYSRQGGLLGVFAGPQYARDHAVYLTYSEPGPGGSGLALARATLDPGARTLAGLKVIWHQLPRGEGGQFGAVVAFAPDGKSLFLASGERQRFTPAQDPNQALGKILHLTLDGQPAADNPLAGKTGASSVPVFPPPSDTEAAKTADAVTTPVGALNRAPAETWSSGHRNPYGLAFDAAGRLWEVEMGPRGGDELNLIARGGNYGWPLVSYGKNYNGKPIPGPDSRPDFRQPAIYWNPVISPGGMIFYDGKRWPAWRGSAFIASLSGQALIRIAFDGATARQTDRWDMGARIRDVGEDGDGNLWVLEDGPGGALKRLTPKP